MQRQSFGGGVRWIVADDGDEPARPTLGQIHVRSERKRKPGHHSLVENLRAAQNQIGDARAVLFIEDDDYYSPTYVQRMVDAIDAGADIAGTAPHVSFHSATWRFNIAANKRHAALCATALGPGAFAALAAETTPKHDGRVYVDVRTWTRCKGAKAILDGSTPIVVGVKGLPGRLGAETCHRVDYHRWKSDGGETVRRWLGDDANAYTEFLK